MATYELTILMPCLNESASLASCINKAKLFLQKEKVHGEILIADNGSTDNSLHIAQELGARTISVLNKGYGSALKSGIQQAKGRFIIMGDADDSYDFFHLNTFLHHLREGCDLVMGNRFQGRIHNGAMPFLNRYVGNPILTFLGQIFFKSKIGDFHCGLRGFNREKILNLNLQCEGMEFASEMIVKASLNQLKTTEVPIQLFPDGRSGRSHLRPWRDGWRHLSLLLLLSPRWLFLYPGLLLFLTGFILASLLIASPIQISKLSFDIDTLLLGCMLMVIGVQIVYFAFFAKRLASPLHFNHFKMEYGLILGFILLLLGGVGTYYASSSLPPTDMIRVLTPSLTLFILGVQTIFASFFMKLITIHVKPSNAT